jgi:hypothetical protein
MFWRTIGSQNQSAQFDDGIVEFEREETGNVRVRIFARQKFSLPVFWQVFDIDLLPEIKDQIVERAYLTYVSSTIENLMAQFYGRPGRIGSPARPAKLEPHRSVMHTERAEGEPHLQAEDQRLRLKTSLIRSLSGWFDPIQGATFGAHLQRATLHEALLRDEDGYHHFQSTVTPPPSANPELTPGVLNVGDIPWSELIHGLAEAIRKDLGLRGRDG